MKPTTQERIDRLAQAVRDQYPELAGKDIGKMRAVAWLVLKEQDRDTRHACAEAINSIGASDPMIGPSSQIVLNAFKQTAHNACMNAKAI